LFEIQYIISKKVREVSEVTIFKSKPRYSLFIFRKLHFWCIFFSGGWKGGGLRQAQPPAPLPLYWTVF